MRHVQAIDKDTREAQIPKSLLGGRKLFDQRRERLAGVANALADQLRRVKKMFWMRTQRGQTANQIVTEFLKKQPGVKPADRGKNAWAFWQKAYPTKFEVKQARTTAGRQVIVFTPLDEEMDDLEAIFSMTPRPGQKEPVEWHTPKSTENEEDSGDEQDVETETPTPGMMSGIFSKLMGHGKGVATADVSGAYLQGPAPEG